jgi:hypothetical protein
MTFALSNHQPSRGRVTSSRLALAAFALAALYGAVKADEPTRAIRSVKTKEADDTVKACLAFNKLLEAAVDSHPDDYLAIEPASRPAVDVNEAKLCLTGHDYGTRYRVTVRPGFTYADGSRMRADETAVIASDRTDVEPP